MNNISDIKDCFGCGVCSASCPRDIISIKLNENGFYEPQITNPEGCINCGICLDVCSFRQKGISQSPTTIRSWAAWSNDAKVRQKCSSGGIAFEIGRQLIDKGYTAVGCRYNIDTHRAEHYLASDKDLFFQSIGSKYIQSYTADAFKHLRNRKQKFLVIGTPCQIDSVRRMTRKFRCEDNFILMDFFCHCVPSMNAWNAYMKMWNEKVSRITNITWRNKSKYGWHDSYCMTINSYCSILHDTETDNTNVSDNNPEITSRWSQGDLFYKLFLGDVCHGPQCEKQCKYKYRNSAADIRIGDLWGSTYQKDESGVSALVAFTSKGEKVIAELDEITLIEHPFEIVAEGQMKDNVKRKEMYGPIMRYLRKGHSISSPLFKSILLLQRILTRINIILKK